MVQMEMITAISRHLAQKSSFVDVIGARVLLVAEGMHVSVDGDGHPWWREEEDYCTLQRRRCHDHVRNSDARRPESRP